MADGPIQFRIALSTISGNRTYTHSAWFITYVGLQLGFVAETPEFIGLLPSARSCRNKSG